MTIATKVIGLKERNPDLRGEIQIVKIVITRGDKERKSEKYLIYIYIKDIIKYLIPKILLKYLKFYFWKYSRSKTMPTSRIRTVPKTKGKKKKKRKRIIESDNQSENDEEEEMKIEEQCEPNVQHVDTTGLNEMLSVDKQDNFENNMSENNIEMKDDRLQEIASETRIPQIPQTQEIMAIQKIKKVSEF